MSQSQEDDNNLDLVEIAVVDDRYLAEICIKALKEQKFHATMERKDRMQGPIGGVLGTLLGGLMGRTGGSQSIMVPRFQAGEAKAYLEGSSLLGPV